jgi:hypothetical protein
MLEQLNGIFADLDVVVMGKSLNPSKTYRGNVRHHRS